MPGYLCDLEDFTTDALRAEIRRREECDRKGECWYCHRNKDAHTCKYATKSAVPGWDVEPAQFIRDEDCMGNPMEYWRVWARNPVTGDNRCGTGETAAAALARCVQRCQDADKMASIVSR